MRKEAIIAKEMLSNSNHSDYDVCVEGLPGDIDFEYNITKAEFEAICKPVFNKLIPLISGALVKAGQQAISAIDEVLMVGGSTRIPKVQALV